jgi:hypothetical protein
MKTLLIISMCLFIGNGLIGQDSKSTKPSKKEQRKAKMVAEYKMTDSILSARKFVLEAHQLRNRQGAQINVTPNLNFVSVDSLRGIIQIGSNEQAGYNGVGGITVDGKVSNWKFSKDDKKMTFDIFMTIQSDLQGIYDVTMTVDYSGYADASVTGMKSGRLTFSGVIHPREDSSVFKGQSH